MEYEEDPNYNYLVDLFKNIITKVLNDKIDFMYDWVNVTDAENHIKTYNELSFDNSKLENSSMNNNMNSITLNSKNNISNLEDASFNENNNKNKKKKERMSHYDEVIDEIYLIKKEKDKKKETKNNNDDNNKKMKERKHGECCLLF